VKLEKVDGMDASFIIDVVDKIIVEVVIVERF
jgi:hypothetical protein